MGRKGSALVLAYFLTSALVGWIAVGFRRSAVEVRAAERLAESAQAFQLAEAGVDDALYWLKTQASPPSGTAYFNPFNGARALGKGQFTAVIDPDDQNPTAYTDYYSLNVSGVVGSLSVTRSVAHMVQNESFSRYAYFTNYERSASNNPIWFTSNDNLTGPVHSNDQFNMKGTPTFGGEVSSTASSINYYSGGPPADNPNFNGGLTLNATSIAIPTQVTALRSAAASSGLWLNGNTTIAMQSDGTMLVTNSAAGWTNQPVAIPANGAVFVDQGNLTVSGTMHGQATLGASNNVVIASSVVYATDPRVDSSSTDVLGLVAEQNVVVSSSAPTNVSIHASVMGINSSFGVENYWVGPAKGTLSVLGGIIQTRRGAVGTFNGSTGAKVSGYTKDYQYDTRLSSLSPPFYPTTTEYQATMWQEN